MFRVILERNSMYSTLGLQVHEECQVSQLQTGILHLLQTLKWTLLAGGDVLVPVGELPHVCCTSTCPIRYSAEEHGVQDDAHARISGETAAALPISR